MSSGIIETIKKVALNVFEANNPVKVLFGNVTSTEPIIIEVLGTKLSLTNEFLVINGEVNQGDNVTLIRVQGGQKYVVLGNRTVYTENTIYVGGVDGDSSVIDKAVSWALNIANDDTHGYDQTNRWGPDYDCSSLVISAFEQAGLPVKKKGASYTGNMYKAFKACGFKDVTKSIKLKNGDGIQKGDVLLNTGQHTALVVSPGQIVHASQNENKKVTGGKTGDQTKKEIYVRNYYNHPWDYVLRYTE